MAVTYEPIASQTLGSNAASVTFSDIPQNFTDLVGILTTEATSNVDCVCRVNNDSGSNYSNTRIVGNGASAASYRNSNLTWQPATLNNAALGSGIVVVSELCFQSYTNTSIYKTTLQSGAAANSAVMRSVSLWRNTSAITRLDFIALSGNFATGSTFSLYGIKAA